MDPDLSAGGRSEEYGCPSGTFELEEDFWSSIFRSPSLLPPLGMSSSPALAAEINYDAAPPGATHGAGTVVLSPERQSQIQSWSPSMLLEDTQIIPSSGDDGLVPMDDMEHHDPLSDEVEQTTMPLPPLMAGDGLGNNNNGGPAVSSRSSAVPVVEQGAFTDELTHQQQQHPLLTNDLEAHRGGACGDNDASLINEQIQQMTPTTLPSQPPSSRSATPVMIPGRAEVNHATSALMGLQVVLSPVRRIPSQSPSTAFNDTIHYMSQPSSSWNRGLPSMGEDNDLSLVDEQIQQTIPGPAGANLITQATTADDLLHPQQQHPLLTNDLDVDRGGACGDNDASLINEQIQQMTTTTLPSQLPSCRSATPVMIAAGRAEVNHATSSLMGLQAGTLIPSAPQDQDVDMLSRAQTQGREKKRPPRRATVSRGSRSALTQAGIYDYLLDMGQNMVQQLGNHIREIMDDELRKSVVWLHFSASTCEYCGTKAWICKHCKIPIGIHCKALISSVIANLLDHMNRLHPIELLFDSSTALKRTQQSSSQNTEITENPNGESEQTIEADNSNATAAPMDTNADLPPLPRTQHQLPIDLDDPNSWPPSHEQVEPCCEGLNHSWKLDRPPCAYLCYHVTWPKFIILLSGSSYCLSTTKSTQEPFILKYTFTKEGDIKVKVQSSPAWELVRATNPAGIVLTPGSFTAFRPWLSLESYYSSDSVPLPGWQFEWKLMQHILCSLGFRKEFAGKLVMHIYGKVSNCRYKSIPPNWDNEDTNNVEEGDSSRNSKRKVRATWSKVWGHFKRVSQSQAVCNHCDEVIQAHTKDQGTSLLRRHIKFKHREHAESI